MRGLGVREMMNPKVSVIIPNYNHARFLEARITSVLNQTYHDFEVIYLDDASTDNSNEVFSRFAGDNRIRANFNNANSGSPFRQWNKGVEFARGQYVWIAESDDVADKTFLEELVPCLDANPNVGLAFCKSWKIDDQGDIVASWEEWTVDGKNDRWKKDFVEQGTEECYRQLIVGITIPNASSVLMRRDIYQKAGCADGTMKIAGDWLMWVKMLLLSDVAFVAKPLNYFRSHPYKVTKRTFVNGVLIQEDYKVIGHILKNLDVPSSVVDRVADRMASRWINGIISLDGWIPLRRNWAIYQQAREIDRCLFRRFLGKALLRVPRAVWRRIQSNSRPTLR